MLAPQDWLFYEIQSPDILISLLPLLTILFFAGVINRLLRREKIHVAGTALGLLLLLAGTCLCFSKCLDGEKYTFSDS